MNIHINWSWTTGFYPEYQICSADVTEKIVVPYIAWKGLSVEEVILFILKVMSMSDSWCQIIKSVVNISESNDKSILKNSLI